MEMRGVNVISAAEVDGVLGKLALVEVVRSQAEAFQALETAQCPHRISLTTRAHTQLFMPTHLPRSRQAREAREAREAHDVREAREDHETSGVSVVKIVSVPKAGRGIPGVNLVLGEDGAVSDIVNSTRLTAVRTAGGSLLSAILALGVLRDRVDRLVVFGDGLQALMHTWLFARYFPLTSVTIIVGPHRALAGGELATKHAAFVAQLRQLDCHVQVSMTGKQEVRSVLERMQGVGVVCTCTPSTEALFESEWLRGRVHVCAVGSYTPRMCELPHALVRCVAQQRALVVDSLAACRSEAGCLLQALDDADWTHIIELGSICPAPELDDAQWMRSAAEARGGEGVSIFKSVGVATQDASLTRLIVTHAPINSIRF